MPAGCEIFLPEAQTFYINSLDEWLAWSLVEMMAAKLGTKSVVIGCWNSGLPPWSGSGHGMPWAPATACSR